MKRLFVQTRDALEIPVKEGLDAGSWRPETTHFEHADVVKLAIGLSCSNLLMMAAWFALLPFDIPVVLNIFISWLLVAGEYVLHVTANRRAENLGLIRLRGVNEGINFLAFLIIALIAHQVIHWQYLVACSIFLVVAYLFLVAPQTKHALLLIVAVGVLISCIVIVVWFPVPLVSVKMGLHPIVWGGLPLLLLGGCLASNTFMILAWYSHLGLKGWLHKEPPFMVAFGVSWGIALLEYSLLIPTNKAAYGYVSLMSLWGYMELTTVSVFLLFAYLRKEPLRWKHLLGFFLLCTTAIAFLIA